MTEIADVARIGQEVALSGSERVTGTVIAIKPVDGRLLYEVFISRTDRRFVPADQVELIPDERDLRVIERDEFLRRLLLFKLRHPLSDVLYTYRASRTAFEVYQFKPVFKFLGSDLHRLLIADEVGLGKTIEASLIYLELKARADLPRVLVCCPSTLKEKWRSELKLRFDEDFRLLDTGGLRQFLKDYEGTGGLQRLQGIVSLELIRRPEFRERFVDAGLMLDLLIIDEAHHVRNQATETHRSARILADRSENVVLLTATPLQTGTSDLFNVLQLVDPATFEREYEFAEVLKPNAYINRAVRALGEGPPDVITARSMVSALQAFPELRDNPVLQRIGSAMDEDRDWSPDRIAADRMDLLGLNSLAFVFTRTRKRDVAKTAKRSSFTARVVLSPDERAFYDAMLRYIRRQVQQSGGGFYAFALVTRERQAASCLIAARKYLADTLKSKSSDIQLEDSGTGFDEGADRLRQEELDDIRQLLTLSQQLGERDSKFEMFSEVLTTLLEEASSGKVLVFAFFRRTIEYVRERVGNMGFAVYTIHGGVPVEARQRVMEQFEADSRPAVLLSTEVGAEGLDFQFCDTLVNYDLPWNPMKVEQRIGRIDRYGQQRPVIRIVNLVLAETVESRILERLYDRIELFEDSIGDLEPILGSVVQELTREVLSRDLTPKDEAELADQAALRIATLRVQQQQFDKQQAELMAHDSVFLSEVNDAVSEGRVVSAEEIAAAVQGWIADRFRGASLEPVEPGVWHLRPSPEMTAFYADYLARTPEKAGGVSTLATMMHSKLGIPCTFDAGLANRRRGLEFFNARHPLVRAAVDHVKEREAEDNPRDIQVSRVAVAGPSEWAGTYTFFLNVVSVDAITPQFTFVPLVFDSRGQHRPEIARRLLALVQERSSASTADVDLEEFLEVREAQHVVMASERDRIETMARERNQSLLQARLASVQRTFRVKIAKREEWKADVTDAGIRRLRDGEIANLRAQLAERLRELERRSDVRVSYQLVGGGVLELLPEDDSAERLDGSQPPVADGDKRAAEAPQGIQPAVSPADLSDGSIGARLRRWLGRG